MYLKRSMLYFTFFQRADGSISQCQGDLDSPRQPRSLAPIGFGLNILWLKNKQTGSSKKMNRSYV